MSQIVEPQAGKRAANALHALTAARSAASTGWRLERMPDRCGLGVPIGLLYTRHRCSVLRRIVTILLSVALVVVSAAIVAHGHSDAGQEAHCPLCLSLHCANRVLVLRPVAPARLVARRAEPASLPIALPAAEATRCRQDRAPPQL